MHQDTHPELKLIKNPHLRLLLFVLGWLSFAVGIIGIFLPVLPSVPFIILAAACFSRASPRFYHWLLANPYFGQHVADWRRTRAIPRRARRIAIISILISMGTSSYFFVPYLWGKIAMAVVGLSVIIFLIRLPTREE